MYRVVSPARVLNPRLKKRVPEKFDTTTTVDSDLQGAIRKLTQFSKCLSHSTHTSSFHSRLEPNKFRSPSVKAGHNCTKLATAEQDLRLPEMRNKTPQSFRHIPTVSSRSQQPQKLYSLSIPHPRGLMRTETQLAGSKQIHGNACQKMAILNEKTPLTRKSTSL